MSELAGLGSASRKGVVTFLGQEIVVHDGQLIPNHITTFQEPWEPPVVDFLDHLLSGGETVLDIGAYVGLHTAVLQRLVGESGHVVAVEPHPDHAALLRETIERNDWANVELHEKAVTDHSEDATLITPHEATYQGHLESGKSKTDIDSIGEWDVNSAASRIKEIDSEEHDSLYYSTAVETMSFPEVCRAVSGDIELVKVDIERGEPHIIETIAETPSIPVEHVLIEMHPNEFDVLQNLISNLESLGRFEFIVPQKAEPGELNPQFIQSYDGPFQPIVHWDLSQE